MFGVDDVIDPMDTRHWMANGTPLRRPSRAPGRARGASTSGDRTDAVTLCAGLRVVELPGSVAAAFCGTLLAGVGADVVKVEPPDGDPLRGDAALFAAVNGGTSSRIVDPGRRRRALDELVAWRRRRARRRRRRVLRHDADRHAGPPGHPSLVVTGRDAVRR